MNCYTVGAVISALESMKKSTRLEIELKTAP
jgi:hypothetical protein